MAFDATARHKSLMRSNVLNATRTWFGGCAPGRKFRYNRSGMEPRALVFWIVVGVIVAWRIARRARRWRNDHRINTIRIDLGDTVADLRENKKLYQLHLKELRIQMSEIA